MSRLFGLKAKHNILSEQFQTSFEKQKQNRHTYILYDCAFSWVGTDMSMKKVAGLKYFIWVHTSPLCEMMGYENTTEVYCHINSWWVNTESISIRLSQIILVWKPTFSQYILWVLCVYLFYIYLFNPPQFKLQIKRFSSTINILRSYCYGAVVVVRL